MKTYIKYIFLLFFSFNIFNVFAQDKKKPTVKQLVETKQFTFIPTSVSPQRGATRFLDGYFDLTLRNDSLISYLPYFGRSQMAPMTPDEAGMRFTTTDFNYSFAEGKKGRYNLLFKINDQKNNYTFNMTVYPDGTADLIATSTYREQISFRGNVMALKPR